MMFSVQAATLTCQQVSSANLEISQFASKTVEIRCTASGGTVSNIQITPNSNPSTGLTIANSQSMSSSISDQSSSTGKWTVTGDSPNTYTISYTISSSGTNSWTGASTTTADVQSTAQLTVEYVLPPSIFTPTVDSLDYRITNIGGTTATNVKMALYNGATLVYGPTDYPVVEGIAAGATTALQWTNQTGFNESGTYTTKVYIGEILHDSATTTVNAAGGSSSSVNQTTGWNLQSLPKSPTNNSVGAVLSSLSGKFQSAHVWDAENTTWLDYDAIFSEWAEFSLIDETKGFWLYITQEEAQLNVTGTDVSSVNITLYPGWNLIGYPLSTTQNVTDALTSISGQYDDVWTFSGTTALNFNPDPDFQVFADFTQMEQANGYWVRVTAGSPITLELN